MEKDWLILVEKYDLDSARSRFENICEALFKRLYPDKSVRTVRVSQGDGGIDIFIGEIGIEPIDVIQCKFFASGIGDSQKSQIRQSFKTMIESKDYTTKSWTLCIINKLDLNQNIWWSTWKDKFEKKYLLPKTFINLKDGSELIDLLKQNNLYNSSFDLDDSIRIEKLYNKIIKEATVPAINILDVLKKASYPLLQVRNYIENKTKAHIIRNETKAISDWVISKLPIDKKNVLILKGEKGLGKSAILKNVYEKLEKENYWVVGIKADKFYSKSIHDLEGKLFENQLKFDQIITEVEKSNNKLVIIIDQIDALSLTLSSSREFIETYNKLISQLQNNKNIRVIISSRSYDLEYDAELSIYNSDEYQKILVSPLTIEEVKEILSIFNINCSSQKVLELLRIPNHLDIYCRIFSGNSKQNIDYIFSLKDLYDQLWKRYITPTKDLRLKKLIYLVAQKMYVEQRISVGNIYEDEYYQESLYLNSHSLLVEHNSEIQFFHQTFYEYCFARQFVENRECLEDYIKNNEQSLYVRSVIKMVLEYLRDYDIKEYVQSIRNILNSPDYRFHVKSLIISDLGLIKNPCTLEHKLVIELILENTNYEEIFIHSIISKGWVEFLISENIPQKYFSVVKNENDSEDKYIFLKERFSNYNFTLFVNNMNECPTSIINYLNSIHIENKENFIASLLIQINNWSNPDLLLYFEKYIPFKKGDINGFHNFYYYEITQKIYLTNKNYALEKLIEPILEVYEDYEYDYRFEHTLNDTIETFYKDDPLGTFQFLFKLYKQISEKNIVPYFNYENIISPLYKNYKLKDSERSFVSKGEKGIKDYLYDFVENCKKELITNLFLEYKESDNVSILLLIAKGMNTNSIFHRNNILEFIKILISKNIFNGSDDNFQLQIRLLISNIYSFLDADQTYFINNTLLNIKSTYDYWIEADKNGKKKIFLESFGKKQYLFIKALPLDKVKQNDNLYKRFQALQRKFGELNHSKALHSSSETKWGTVGPPLKQSAYNNMNLTHWKKSMLKYNERYQPTEWLKGDIEQHSRAFKDTVKENPEKFYNFINALFEDGQISHKYIIQGVQGLIDGQFDAEKVKKLFKKILTFNTNDLVHLSLLNHQIGYFIKNKNVDEVIILYLQKLIINFPEKEKDLNPKFPLQDALNSIRGSAVYELIYCNYDIKFKEIIFSTIENVIQNPLCNDSVKILILHNLAYLNHLDIERAFKIFIELTNTGNLEILKSSINSAQYFNNKYHTKMHDYFKKILETPEVHKQSFFMISSWLLNLDKEKKLYNEFIKKSKDAKLCALHVAEEFLISKKGTINNNALSILFELLKESDEDLSREYACIILRKFKPKKFSYFFPFLQEYSKSIICIKDPRYFLQYLIKCSKDFPKECVELLSNMDFSANPNIQHHGYYDKEPIQLILSIYSKLVATAKKDKNLINKALNIFDNMLQHSHLRNNANQAIETII